jgi:hypothetical protein
MEVPVKKAAAVDVTEPRPGKSEVKPTTLLDVHEVEWITRELELLLAKEKGQGAAAGADGGRHRRNRAQEARLPCRCPGEARRLHMQLRRRGHRLRRRRG